MKIFKKTLKGKRVDLIRLKPSVETAEIIYEVISKDRKHFMPWISLAKTENSSSPKNVLEYMTSKKKDLDYGVFLNNELIGSVGIFDISKKTKLGKLRYWLKESEIGKGYICESINLIHNEFFKENGLEKIIAYIDDKNKNSINVLKREKYILEKTETYLNDKKETGLYLVYAKLKSGWDKGKNNETILG